MRTGMNPGQFVFEGRPRRDEEERDVEFGFDYFIDGRDSRRAFDMEGSHRVVGESFVLDDP